MMMINGPSFFMVFIEGGLDWKIDQHGCSGNR